MLLLCKKKQQPITSYTFHKLLFFLHKIPQAGCWEYFIITYPWGRNCRKASLNRKYIETYYWNRNILKRTLKIKLKKKIKKICINILCKTRAVAYTIYKIRRQTSESFGCKFHASPSSGLLRLFCSILFAFLSSFGSWQSSCKWRHLFLLSL